MATTPRTSPGRRRTTIGVALCATGGAMTAACVGSAWWWGGYVGDTWLADFGDGTLYTARIDPNGYGRPSVGWQLARNTNRNTGASWTWTWWTFGEPIDSWSTTRGYSVWPAAPAMLASGGAVWFLGARARRRARRQLCLKCGYSLAGLAESAPCPECGCPQVKSAQHELGIS